MAVLVVVVIALAALIGGFHLVLASRLSHDANEVLQARAAAELSSISNEGDRIVVREAPDEAALESDAWVFAGSRLLEGPRTKPALNRAAAALAGEPRDELTRLAATLDNLLERVAASLRHEQRFSSEISHELRTPLTKVRAEAELALRQTRDDESYRKALRRVLAGADQMERIIDSLLVAAREEATTRHGTADAVEAAARAAGTCAQVAESRGVDIQVSTAELHRRVASESNLVERILVPVIDNACRYGQSRVTVTCERRNGTVAYTVTDDGPGVTEAERERIFEPGMRGSAGDDEESLDGAGLGLALARRLARAAHGDVEAHPDEGGGRFTIVLPSV